MSKRLETIVVYQPIVDRIITIEADPDSRIIWFQKEDEKISTEEFSEEREMWMYFTAALLDLKPPYDLILGSL